MTEKDDNNSGAKKKLTLKPSRLTLTKTVESGQIRQSFTHGRSKSVAVEVKRTRNFARDEAGHMVALEQKKAGLGGADELAHLTEDEREHRLRALRNAETRLKSAEDQEEDAPHDVSLESQEKPEVLAEEKDGGEAGSVETAKEEGGESLPSPEPEESKYKLKIIRDAVPMPAKQPDARVGVRAAAYRDEDENASKKLTAKVRRGGEDRRTSGKLTVAQALNFHEERTRSLASVRRQREKARKSRSDVGAKELEKIVRDVTIPETITVSDLANRMATRTVDVIKALMKMGSIVKPESVIDADTAELIVDEFGHNAKRVSEGDVETALLESIGQDDAAEDLKPRPPVVTVMGHVDHGKTSLLDTLRSTNVVAREAGGITQHIGAYQVMLESGDKMTFLDTPGHAAFTAMRLRGAQATDIVILVVAADDGVMEQTKEAINHARAAKVPIIVAVNKIDKPDADPARVKNELLEAELVPEEYGGDIQVVEVSAMTGAGVDKLREAVLLQAEIMELAANPDRPASGVVIESEVDVGRGAVATLLVQRGTLRVGDIILAGTAMGKIRALINDQGEQVSEAPPSVPVQVLGLNNAAVAGEVFAVVDNEKAAREIAEYRIHHDKKLKAAEATKVTLDQMFAQQGEEAAKELSVVVKADVQGSAEAIVQSLEKLSNEEVTVRILHSAVGAITESDITLANASNAIVIGFNVRANKQARDMAERDQVEIRYYSVIYNLVDEVKASLSGLLSPERKENITGYAEIRQIFNMSKAGKVAGCMVTEGVIRRGAGVRLLRDNTVIHEGTLKTLRRFQDDVKEVRENYECGMAFENYEDIRERDMIEAFEIEEISRTI